MRMPIRVLVVDDEPEQRASVCDLLAGDDRFEIAGEAADGGEAIIRASEVRPDIVLIDLMLPGMNGLRAISEIRERVPDAKVVVLSGLVGPERIFEEATRQGASACIEKPLMFGRLPETLLDVAAG